jgi:hypothetical protein
MRQKCVDVVYVDAKAPENSPVDGHFCRHMSPEPPWGNVWGNGPQSPQAPRPCAHGRNGRAEGAQAGNFWRRIRDSGSLAEAPIFAAHEEAQRSHHPALAGVHFSKEAERLPFTVTGRDADEARARAREQCSERRNTAQVTQLPRNSRP